MIRRGIHFEFMKSPYLPDPYRRVIFRIDEGRIHGELLTWDRALMRHLRERFPDEVTFIDFEDWLDNWLLAMPAGPVAEVRGEDATLRDFYFLNNDDPEREGKIRAYIGEP